MTEDLGGVREAEVWGDSRITEGQREPKRETGGGEV